MHDLSLSRAAARRAVSVWSLIVVLSTAVGCGGSKQTAPDRAVVSGLVTFNGQPLPAGTIAFASATKYGGASVSITEGGRYTTDRAPIGSNVVSIDTATIKVGNPAAYVPIPARYADTSTSGLKAEIKPGDNENVNFELTK
jgi:hypothetical protein